MAVLPEIWIASNLGHEAMPKKIVSSTENRCTVFNSSGAPSFQAHKGQRLNSFHVKLVPALATNWNHLPV